MRATNRHSGKQKVAETFRALRPMQPVVSEIPNEPRHYAFELNFDGLRTLCYHDGSQLSFRGMNGIDPNGRFPELADLARFLGSRRTILDGHIVALDESGRADATLLRRRMRAEEPSFALVEQVPVRFVVSDILFDRGRWVLNLPLKERRKRLDRLNLDGLFWRTAERQVGQGQALLRAARQMKLPGVLAKQLGSTYQPGRKSTDWIQISIK
jgi:bifunctional non-homologous end joining protein LigD